MTTREAQRLAVYAEQRGDADSAQHLREVATMTKPIVDDSSYSQEDVLRKLRARNCWFAAERIAMQAREPGAEDWRIVLTAPNGTGDHRRLDDIGNRHIDVRWHGGDLIDDCPLIAKLTADA